MCQCTAPETWLPHPAYIGYYEVSDHGEVRSLTRTVSTPDGRRSWTLAGQPIKPIPVGPPGKPSYLYVNLWKNGVKRQQAIHRLVLTVFVGECPAGMEGRHSDRRTHNNHLPNLGWGTHSENELDKVRHGTHPQASRSHCCREHLLVAPNLVGREVLRGYRICLACERGRGDQSGAKRRGGDSFDLRAACDRHYAQIMGTTMVRLT